MLLLLLLGRDEVLSRDGSLVAHHLLSLHHLLVLLLLLGGKRRFRRMLLLLLLIVQCGYGTRSGGGHCLLAHSGRTWRSSWLLLLYTRQFAHAVAARHHR